MGARVNPAPRQAHPPGEWSRVPREVGKSPSAERRGGAPTAPTAGVATATYQEPDTHERTRLSPPVIAALAALGVPRAIAHDLDLLGPALDFVLAVLPMAAWLLAASRSPEPFRTSLVIGGTYGLMLALTHQALWDEAFDEGSPRLGDNLADAPAWMHSAVTRATAFVSSLATGALVGALIGAGAVLVRRIARSLPRR